MGLDRHAVRLLATLWTGLAASAAPAGAQPATPVADWGLPQLMQTLAKVKAASAQFTERKTMHMLKTPLVTSGTLTYVAPDHMQKLTMSPTPERFALDGDRVTISGGGQPETHTFSAADYPQIGGLVEGIRATLAGDLAALDRFYAVQLSGGPSDWELVLRPKIDELARFITSVRILGSDDRIRAVQTEERGGDQSEMTIVEHVRDGR